MTNSLLPPGRNSWEFDNTEERHAKPERIKDIPLPVLTEAEKKEVRLGLKKADEAQQREYEEGKLDEWEIT